MFDVGRSTFDVRPSVFGVHRAMVKVQGSESAIVRGHLRSELFTNGPNPTLQPSVAHVTLCADMLNLKRFLPLLLFPCLLAGCATSGITNLTPSRLPRKD